MYEKLQIVYSLRIHLILKSMGFKALEEVRNPQESKLSCWVYEKTPEFTVALTAAIRGVAANGKR